MLKADSKLQLQDSVARTQEVEGAEFGEVNLEEYGWQEAGRRQRNAMHKAAKLRDQIRELDEELRQHGVLGIKEPRENASLNERLLARQELLSHIRQRSGYTNPRG